jgi:hypothetical protein
MDFRPMLFTVLLLSACASGTALVTGQQRPPVEARAVQVYLEAPANYEVVAIVSATSRTGFTPQQSLNYALEELRQQAGAVGANGVLIDSSGQGAGGPIVGTVVGNSVIMSGGSHPNIQEVRGRAIYVR